jgi:murein DD-endopeptidase MepM/ murein hydrolase activator NlpD
MVREPAIIERFGRRPFRAATGGNCMAFVMIATGATSRSRVRTLGVRPLLGVAAVLAAALLASGGCLGYWLAAPSAPSALTPAATAANVERPHEASPFTLEQIGALSARLFRLESEAAQLGERLGIERKKPAAAGPAGRASDAQVVSGLAPQAPRGPSGGPLLAPRAEPIDAGTLEADLARVEARIGQLADAAAQRTEQLMRLPTRLPVLGAELTSTFGNRVDPFAHRQAFHAGLDFAAEAGAPIGAAAGGTVAFAGFKPDFGWVVEIDHGNGLVTRYAHASKLLVHAGEIVTPGERIARVGSTGRSTGPHLHFEVLRGGEHVDPKRYLAGL